MKRVQFTRAADFPYELLTDRTVHTVGWLREHASHLCAAEADAMLADDIASEGVEVVLGEESGPVSPGEPFVVPLNPGGRPPRYVVGQRL